MSPNSKIVNFEVFRRSISSTKISCFWRVNRIASKQGAWRQLCIWMLGENPLQTTPTFWRHNTTKNVYNFIPKSACVLSCCRYVYQNYWRYTLAWGFQNIFIFLYAVLLNKNSKNNFTAILIWKYPSSNWLSKKYFWIIRVQNFFR